MERVSESAAVAARDLRVLFSRLPRRLRELSTADDLTPSQTAVLSRLVKHGPSSTSELAGAEGVRPQSMANTLAALDQHGLIRRRPDPDDRRRQAITLTAKGRHRGESARQLREEWLACTLQERFTEQERRTIVHALSLLERLTE
jgi:DNA-binding MarR family transcriptional regulator